MKLLKIILLCLLLLCLSFLVRGLFFQKELSFAIANETELPISDFVVKIDNNTIFNDSIFESSVPCCWADSILGFGFHKVTAESRMYNIKRTFTVFCFKNVHVYIGVWMKENGILWIDRKIHYFLPAFYT